MGAFLTLFVEIKTQGALFMPKTLKELVQSTDNRVYVHLSDQETTEAFIKNAENEGFKFCGGKRISEMPLDDFYALNKNLTVNYINFIGRVAYQCGAENVLRVEYKDFLKRSTEQ